MSPFRFGQYVAKYGVRPAGEVPGSRLDLVGQLGAQSDALQRILEETLRSQEVLNEFQVQLRTSAKTMLVQDATVEWPERESPYRTVSLLLTLCQEINPQPRKTTCRKLAFDVGMRTGTIDQSVESAVSAARCIRSRPPGNSGSLIDRPGTLAESRSGIGGMACGGHRDYHARSSASCEF